MNKKLTRGLSIILIVNKAVSFLVDLIPTFGPYKEWTQDRLTPEREYKGLTYGRLLVSFSHVFGIDIGDTAVNVWMTPKTRVLKSKSDTGKKDIVNITRNYKTFMLDIAYWISDLANIEKNKFKIHKLLKENPGITKDSNHLEIYLKGIRGLVESFDMNGIFEKKIFPNVYNKTDALDKLYNNYMGELNRRIYNFKYNRTDNDPMLHIDYLKTIKAVNYSKELAEKWLR